MSDREIAESQPRLERIFVPAQVMLSLYSTQHVRQYDRLM